MSAAVIVATAAWLFYIRTSLLVPAVLSVLVALAICQHKANVRRLLNGTENRFQFKTFSSPANRHKDTQIH